MSAAQLLSHFDRISDSPDAIPRLRQFILDLAVRGKLVEQDPRDESASELLKRIDTERERHSNKDAIRKNRAASQDVADETPFELPQSWVWASLGQVSQYGLPDKIDSNKMISSNTWVLDLEDIEKNTSRLIDRVPSSARPFQSSKTRFKQGDVLFGKLRPYLNKVLVADSDGVCTTEIVPVRGFGGIAPEYIRLVLKSPLTMKRIDRLMYGMKMPRLGTDDALGLSFPLPPLGEQHRIVAKVDELMTLCDRLEAEQMERENCRDRLVTSSLSRLNNGEDPGTFRDHARFYFNHLPRLTTKPEHIQQLRQTILNLAVRGKLVPQDPNDEPAAELLKRTQTEKMRLLKAGTVIQQKLTSSKSRESAFAIPMNWQAVNLSDVCNLVTSGSRGWAEFYSNTGPKFIRAQNIRFGRLQLEDLACVNLPKRTEGTRTQVSKGDLLIVITGAGVTNPAMLDHDLGEAYVSQHVGLIKPTTQSLSRWLLLCLMAPAGARAELVQRAYGAGKPGLNLDNIRSLRIALPPLAEQQRIVAKVDELMALCDRLETHLTITHTDSRRLLDAFLHEALNLAV